MNKFEIQANHRLGLKSKSITKLNQAEIIHKEIKKELELHEIYGKSEPTIIQKEEIHEKPVMIDITKTSVNRVTSEPKMRAVVLQAYQKFLKKEFKQ